MAHTGRGCRGLPTAQRRSLSCPAGVVRSGLRDVHSHRSSRCPRRWKATAHQGCWQDVLARAVQSHKRADLATAHIQVGALEDGGVVSPRSRSSMASRGGVGKEQGCRRYDSHSPTTQHRQRGLEVDALTAPKHTARMADPPRPTPFKQEVVPNPARRAMFWLTVTFAIPIVLAAATLTRYAVADRFQQGRCDDRSIFHDQWVSRCADRLAETITPTIAVIVAAGCTVFAVTFLVLFTTRDPYRLRLAGTQPSKVDAPFSVTDIPIDAGKPTTSDWTCGVAVLVAIIGTFLPWASIATVFGKVSFSGIEGDGSDGIVVLVLGIVAGITTAAFATKRRLWVNFVTMLLGIAIAAIGIVDTIDVERLADDSDAPDSSPQELASTSS